MSSAAESAAAMWWKPNATASPHGIAFLFGANANTVDDSHDHVPSTCGFVSIGGAFAVFIVVVNVNRSGQSAASHGDANGCTGGGASASSSSPRPSFSSSSPPTSCAGAAVGAAAAAVGGFAGGA